MLSLDAASNRLTVRLQDGTDRTYDPRRQRGVSVFREEVRRFSVGDRIQFTAPANDLKIANRELGVIRGIDEVGRLNLTMDSGRSIDVGRVLQVGAGGVGSALDFWLTLAGIVGAWTVVDGDEVEV